MRFIIVFSVLVFFATLPVDQSTAQPVERSEVTTGDSGLPLPRFVSLAADRAFMRTGPGEQYPIMWVYKRENYPFQIVAEYDSWRKIRDVEGTEGWMHVILLSGARTGVITGSTQTLYSEPNPGSLPVLRAEAGVIGNVQECGSEWCRMEINGTSGWLRKAQFWGTFLDEEFE